MLIRHDSCLIFFSKIENKLRFTKWEKKKRKSQYNWSGESKQIYMMNEDRIIFLAQTEKNSIYFQLIFVGKNLFLFSHLANRRINARQSLLRYLRISNWIFEPISPKSESIAFIIINLNSRTSITVACLIVKHLKIGKKCLFLLTIWK